jgi:uncharacterized protein
MAVPNHRVIRALHTYGSMLAAVAVLGFAVTGLLLNNAARLGLDQGAVTSCECTVPADLLKTPDPNAIVAALRQGRTIPGDLGAFEVEDDAVRVVFRAPGCTTDVRINRADGRATIECETRGPTGALLDLHRGKHTGTAWRVLMDVVAVLLAGSALTGIVLAFMTPNRRPLALGLLAVSAVVAVGAYFLLV